jgi:hypothetical protein
MNDANYIGLDAHQATISAAVLDSAGNLGNGQIAEVRIKTFRFPDQDLETRMSQ